MEPALSIEILMPALSPTMEEGTLAKWLVQVGDTVKAGDVIAEIETDKATMEVETIDEGVVEALLVAAGSQGVKVNTPIARISGDEEVAAPTPTPPPVAAAPASVTAPASVVTSAPVALADPEIPPGTPMVKVTLRDALRDAMAEEMRRDPDVFLMGEEVGQYQGAYKVSRGLLEEFGDRRVIDTPITEHGFAGMGVGAAMAGLKPIVEFMTMNFAMQAIDHIINSAAKVHYMSGGQISAPIVFRGPNGAASRVGAQHSHDYSSWYGNVPGLKVIAPYDAADAKGLLKAAIRDPNPVVFLEHELLYGIEFDVPEGDDWVVPIGKAKVRREGTDLTITAHSRMVGFALQAAEELAALGISAEVIDLRTLRPLDTETIIASVKKTNRLVTAEEGWGPRGVGAEVIACVIDGAFDWLDAPPMRVHQKDTPLPYAANLEKLSLPNAADIVAAARAVTNR
ncbi:MAG: pyruvate dehydrogenase complex E1 component subunit beta [Hyphomonadaceae bacterium]